MSQPFSDEKGPGCFWLLICSMTTPNMGEILVQQAEKAERHRLLLLAYECETIQEFCEKLLERLNK